jgi:hypothetical protein
MNECAGKINRGRSKNKKNISGRDEDALTPSLPSFLL